MVPDVQGSGTISRTFALYWLGWWIPGFLVEIREVEKCLITLNWNIGFVMDSDASGLYTVTRGNTISQAFISQPCAETPSVLGVLGRVGGIQEGVS